MFFIGFLVFVCVVGESELVVYTLKMMGVSLSVEVVDVLF